MKPRMILAIAAVALIGFAPQARADSDGYYCVGGGFLAVELRSFNTPGLTGAHVLKIAMLDTLHGAHWTDQVIVEDFQTHVLSCGMNTILLEGAGGARAGFDSYTIDVDAAGKATISQHRYLPFYSGEVTPVEPPNLGDWATPGTTMLPQIGAGSASFQLRVTHISKPVSRDLIQHDRLSVVERVVNGQIRDSLIVYESHRKLPPENGGVSSASMRLELSAPFLISTRTRRRTTWFDADTRALVRTSVLDTCSRATRRTHAWVGATIGLVAGAGIGYLIAIPRVRATERASDGAPLEGIEYVIDPTLGGILGAVAGGIIGSHIGNSKCG